MAKRVKKEPCEFCDCGFDDYLGIYAEESKDVVLELYPGHCISVHAFIKNSAEETVDASVTIPMNYCPVCGKKWEM